jgi:hypothetical protein
MPAPIRFPAPVIRRRPAVAAYRVIDEEELLGGSDWLAPAIAPPAPPRRRRLRAAALATTLVAVPVAAGLVAAVRLPRSAERPIRAAAPPLTRPVADHPRPARAFVIVHREPLPGRERPAARRRSVVRAADVPVAPDVSPAATAPVASAAQEFGFER